MGQKTLDGRIEDALLDRLLPGEPFFVIRGRDALAVFAVRDYVKRLIDSGGSAEKVASAMECVNQLRAYAHAKGTKVAD